MLETKVPTDKIITRLPPSPTGNFHIGTARTALFNYLFTRHARLAGADAKMILRFEDTDKERSKKEYEQNIQEGLAWLGLQCDERPYRQSERTDLYKKYLRQMVDSGQAFVSKEQPKEAGQRGEVIRFKNPNVKISFHDLIRGDIEFDTTDLGDFVIAKSFDEPLYHLAVVIDDFEMGVTHVIRGEDHISNTPRQILIQRALAASGAAAKIAGRADVPQPIYAHIPLILAADRSKMSKRHGATAISEYRDRGYLPEAMINFLALLGWNPGTEQEILSLDELIAQFDLSKVQKGGAIFNEEKLRWINKEYMKKLPAEQIVALVKKSYEELYPDIKGVFDAKRTSDAKKISGAKEIPAGIFEKITPLILERAMTMNDIKLAAGDFSYFIKKPAYEVESLVWQGSKNELFKGSDEFSKTRARLEHAADTMKKMSGGDFTADKIKSAIWDYATQEGRGQVLWPMRMALSGRDKSPDPFQLAEILGKEETLARINEAIARLA